MYDVTEEIGSYLNEWLLSDGSTRGMPFNCGHRYILPHSQTEPANGIPNQNQLPQCSHRTYNILPFSQIKNNGVVPLTVVGRHFQQSSDWLSRGMECSPAAAAFRYTVGTRLVPKMEEVISKNHPTEDREAYAHVREVRRNSDFSMIEISVELQIPKPITLPKSK